MSIGQVADELGVEYRRVMRAELGTQVTYEFLCRLAHFYDRPVTYFLYQYPATA